MEGAVSVTVQQQETRTTRETRMETYNSGEQENMGNKEKMRFLNHRFFHIIEQEDIRKLQLIESKVQEERKSFESIVSNINEDHKSKMKEIWIMKEENTMLVQEKTRFETKVKELSKT